MDVRYDRADLDNSEVTKEGYIKANAIVSRSGVFLYKNGDGTIRRELRHPDDIFQHNSIETLKMIPITMDHPKEAAVTAENAKRLTVGYTGETVNIDGRYLRSNIKITDKNAVKVVTSGEKDQLSLGYQVNVVKEKGVYNGQEYDHRQTDIRYNHLAIVKEARAGDSASINLDSNEAEVMNMPVPKSDKANKEFMEEDMEEKEEDESLEEEKNKDKKKKKKDEERKKKDKSKKKRKNEMEEEDEEEEEYEDEEHEEEDEEEKERNDSIVLDGIEYKASRKVVKAYKNLVRKNEKLRARNDSLRSRTDGLERELSEENLNNLVNEKLDLVDKASKVLNVDSAELIELSEKELKQEIIEKIFPDAELEGVSNDYLDARFDSAVEISGGEASGVRSGSAMMKQRVLAAPRYDGSSNNEVETAKRDMEERVLAKKKRDRMKEEEDEEEKMDKKKKSKKGRDQSSMLQRSRMNK